MVAVSLVGFIPSLQRISITSDLVLRAMKVAHAQLLKCRILCFSYDNLTFILRKV